MTADRALSERRRKQLWPTVAISLSGLLLIYLNFEIFHSGLLPPAVALVCICLSIYLLAFSGGIFGDYLKGAADTHLFALLPGFVLTVMAVRNASIIDFGALVFESMLVGGALTVLAASIDQTVRNWPSVVLGSLIFSACYGYGVVTEANVALDNSLPDLLHMTVANKSVTYSSHGSTGYRLTLSPWEPLAERRIVAVDQNLFNAVGSGSTVCIGVHAGGLGIRWYQGAQRCAH